MNKTLVPIVGILLLLGVLFIIWQDNLGMKWELLQKDFESEQLKHKQEIQSLNKKLRLIESENRDLKKQLDEQNERLVAVKPISESAETQKNPTKVISSPKMVLEEEKSPSIQVQLLEDRNQQLDSEKDTMSLQLKTAEQKIKELENENSEHAFRLSSAMAQESQDMDPLLRSIPTRSTIHNLVQHNIKAWLELGEFMKLSLDRKDFLGRTPVHLAAELGLKDQLEVLYKFGEKVDEKDMLGYTPLQRAIESKADTLTWFNGKAVNYEVKDRQGWRLMHHAAKVGNISAAKFLQDKGQDIDQEVTRGITPLMIALAYRQDEMVFWLLKKGARINARDNLGQSVMHYVARFSEEQMVRLLIKYHPTINVPDGNGRTPLHYAAILGRNDMVKTLLNYGAIAVFKDNGHCSPIHHAAMGNHNKVVETFLEYGVHVDDLDVVGRTPLHIAVVLGNVKLVNLLLSWGANIAMQDGVGKTPEQWAKELGRHHIIKLFEDL